LAYLVLLDSLDHLVSLALLVAPVHREVLGLLGLRETWVHLEELVLLVLRVLRARKVLMVIWVLLESLELLGQQVVLAYRVRLDSLDFRELLDQLELLVVLG